MSKAKLYQKLARAEKNYDPVLKNAYNPHFKSKFANLNSLLQAVTSALTAEGLLLLQPVEGDKVVTQIIDIETGELISSFITIPASIVDPQKILAAITYLRRGGLQSLLGLTGEDDDGNYASGKVDKLETTETNKAKPVVAAAAAKPTPAPVTGPTTSEFKRPLGGATNGAVPAAAQVTNGSVKTTKVWDG